MNIKVSLQDLEYIIVSLDYARDIWFENNKGKIEELISFLVRQYMMEIDSNALRKTNTYTKP